MSGRISKYKPQYNQQIINYFDRNPYDIKYINGKVKRVPCQFPTLEGFANKVNVNGDTLVEWASDHNRDKYPGFSAAYRIAKQLQINILIQNGLVRLYKANFAIFLLRNLLRYK